jgi:hypothetical protein
MQNREKMQVCNYALLALEGVSKIINFDGEYRGSPEIIVHYRMHFHCIMKNDALTQLVCSDLFI